jgi:hypothetical protein
MAMKNRTKSKARKRKAKIKFKQSARIVEKNDATKVARRDTFPTIQGRPPASVAPVFRVKIKKKR